MTKLKRITLSLGCFLLAGLLHAQFENAEVLGTVRDQSGGALPKATVTLTNQDTGIKAQTSTDENGNFDFFNVKVGRYTLMVEHRRLLEGHHDGHAGQRERPPARGRRHASRRS